MAENNHRDYLRGSEVWIKKYFYVLRPVPACRGIERGHGVVPMEFSRLVESVVDEEDLRQAVQDLLRRKRAGEELDRGPRIAAISDFLDAEVRRLSTNKPPPGGPTSIETLDRVFLASLLDVYGDSIRQSAAAASPGPSRGKRTRRSR